MRRIVYAVILVLLLSWGCHKKSSSVPVPVAPPVASAPETEAAPRAIAPALSTPEPAPLKPAPIPKTISSPNSLDLGEMSFLVGKYRQAAESLEDFVRTNPTSAKRERALFLLKQIEHIFALQQQIERMKSDLKDRDEKIKKLSEELQRLKEIDLQSRPSRPSE